MRPDPTGRPGTGALHRMGVLCRHNLTLVARDPHHLVAYLVMPMVLLTVLRPLYVAALGPAGSDQATPGMLVMFSLLALNMVGTAVLSERTWQTWDRLRATPASPVELLAAKALPLLAALLGQQAVLLGFGMLTAGLRIHGLRPAALLVAVGLVWGLCVLACGAALATVARGHSQLATICDVGSMIVTCLGGALVPLATMPGWARLAAPLSPGYWGMAAFHSALRGQATGTAQAVGVLLTLAGLAGAFACWRIARGAASAPA